MRWLFLFLVLGLVACGGGERLEVRQFHMRQSAVERGNDFIAAEQKFRLYGAVTAEERELRKGQYFLVRWRELQSRKPVKMIMETRRAGSGARIIHRTVNLGEQMSGKHEFAFAGKDYEKNGRVTAWRIRLLQGGKEVARKQSFLWE